MMVSPFIVLVTQRVTGSLKFKFFFKSFTLYMHELYAFNNEYKNNASKDTNDQVKLYTTNFLFIHFKSLTTLNICIKLQ